MSELSSTVKSFLQAMAEARLKHQSRDGGEDWRDYLRSVPHYLPFDSLLGEGDEEAVRCALQTEGGPL